MPPRSTLQVHAAPVLSLLILAGMWAEQRAFHAPVGDPAAYHAHVRALADQLPSRIREWVGTDVPAPTAAVAMLRPNVLVGREFRNSTSGERATLLVVQCEDARDMGGHWPPACYGAQGWTLREERARTVRDEAAGLGEIPLTVYRFTIESMERYDEIWIHNFFAHPKGTLERDRRGVRRAAQDRRMKGFGAAQIQVIFDTPLPEARRDEIFRTLVAGAAPLIEAVRREDAR
jgi:hypothetical protein